MGSSMSIQAAEEISHLQKTDHFLLKILFDLHIAFHL